jgi:hypothetical protein
MFFARRAVPIEGDELRAKLTNLFNKVAYEPGLWALTHMGSAKRVHVPTLCVTARHQSTNASDLVQRMLWEAGTKGFSQFGVGGFGQAKHPCCRRQVGDGLKVPNDD